MNHKTEFKNWLTGACTNKIENLWRHAKQKGKAMYGMHTKWIQSYLDTFLWRREFGRDGGITTMDHLMSQIASWI